MLIDVQNKILYVAASLIAVVIIGATIWFFSTHSMDPNMTSDGKLIKRSVFFSNPDKINVSLSPNGKHLAYIAPLDGVLNIYVAPINQLEKAKAVTADNRGITRYNWSYKENVLFYYQDQDGNENYHIYMVNLADGKVSDITPHDNTRAYIAATSYTNPDKIVIAMNDRDPSYHDIYMYDLASNTKTLLYKNDSFSSFVFDHNLRIRFASKLDQETGAVQIFKMQDQNFVEYQTIATENVLTSGILGFDATNDSFYMLDSQDRDTGALYKISYQDEAVRELIAEDERADISEVLLHPKTYAYEGHSVEYLKPEWHFVPEIQATIDFIKAAEEGGVMHVTSRTLEDDLWVVAFSFDNDAIKYFLIDRAKKKIQYLFVHNSKVAGVHAKLRPMLADTFKAIDGTTIPFYITLPKDSNNQSNPMVLLVHGGPNARDSWGYSAQHQWLANRGFTVMSVNYRGSTGFGKNYINIAKGQWSKDMHTDLTDAVRFAVAKGYAAKNKVAIMGGSYGGYAALVGMTFTPEVFACGIDLVGPSNLETLANSIPEYWKPMRKILIDNLGGDPNTDEGRKELASRSPVYYASRIKNPLLIAHGANDPRVKKAEAEQMVNAMKKNKVPGTYVLYEDEGHGFVKPQNRVSYFAIVEEFLGKCFNIQVEEITDEVAKSSAKIEHF